MKKKNEKKYWLIKSCFTCNSHLWNKNDSFSCCSTNHENLSGRTVCKKWRLDIINQRSIRNLDEEK